MSETETAAPALPPNVDSNAPADITQSGATSTDGTAAVGGDVETVAPAVMVNMISMCNFRMQNGKTLFIGKGSQALPEGIANHWFVRAHSDNPLPKVLKPGTPEYAADQARQVARSQLLDAAVEEAAQNAVEKAGIKRRPVRR
jgi:hypothetical protein